MRASAAGNGSWSQYVVAQGTSEAKPWNEQAPRSAIPVRRFDPASVELSVRRRPRVFFWNCLARVDDIPPHTRPLDRRSGHLFAVLPAAADARVVPPASRIVAPCTVCAPKGEKDHDEGEAFIGSPERSTTRATSAASIGGIIATERRPPQPDQVEAVGVAGCSCRAGVRVEVGPRSLPGRGSFRSVEERCPQPGKQPGLRRPADGSPNPAGGRLGPDRRAMVAVADDVVQLPIRQLEKALCLAISVIA
jgi:hypothetical protein